MNPSLRSRKRSLQSALGLALTLSLVAAACGGAAEETVSGDTAAGSVATEPETTDAQPEAHDETVGSDGDETVGGSHSFPDLVTTNIADGSSLNLSEQLAGGTTPVLLWFFAPH